jgi:hypothetical protein
VNLQRLWDATGEGRALPVVVQCARLVGGLRDACFARDATVASTSPEYGCVELTRADIGSNGWQPRSKPVG